MAQVIGSLREDRATYGERVVLKLLKDNLPKEFSVYVECPIHGKRVHRYPDFIVLTNYGFIILEVKDWVEVLQADNYNVEVRTRQNKLRQEHNPVTQARDIATLLNEELHAVSRAAQRENAPNIPWGYAVVLPNVGTAVLSQLRRVWGDEFVLNRDDLDAPLIKTRLKMTLPEARLHPLSKEEIEIVRAAINPTVIIETQGRSPVILDDRQERIIAEPVQPEAAPIADAPAVDQGILFDLPSEQPGEAFIKSGAYEKEIETQISHNPSIRLVRGVAGSGKTLVLGQRARYLSAQFPEWSILVLTYNDHLRRQFEASLRKLSNVRPMTFHSLCSSLLRDYKPWVEPTNPGGWIENQRASRQVLKRFSTEFLESEITWIKETGIEDRQSYLTVDRKGRGQAGRLTQLQREQVYDLLQEYDRYLQKSGIPDWADISSLVMNGITRGKIIPPKYDVILIDEAQDFAPVWFNVVKACLDPDHGVLFMADDPAQSIYRFFSWKEKGIDVVGRTRWLNVPYRNTFEIYLAAYHLIADDPTLAKSLDEEGVFVVPDLNSAIMRHGPRPLIEHFGIFDDEIFSIRTRIAGLIQKGVPRQQIAVFHRKNHGVERLKAALRGLDVVVDTFHAYKGMEFDVVFLTQLQKTEVPDSSAEQLSAERRLAYMAMTRARKELYMGFEYKLPDQYQSIQDFVDMI